MHIVPLRHRATAYEGGSPSIGDVSHHDTLMVRKQGLPPPDNLLPFTSGGKINMTSVGNWHSPDGLTQLGTLRDGKDL